MSEKKQYLKIVRSLVLIVCTGLLAIATVLGWYVQLQHVDATGMTVGTEGDKSVIIRDLMEVKRYLGDIQVSDKWYHSTSGGKYFEYDIETEDYKLDDDNNQIPLSFTNLLPGEYIDITMWYMTRDTSKDNFKIGILDLDDTDGKFKETVDGVEYTHTALGVFRIAEITYDAGGDPVVDDDDWNWFATYNGDTEEDTIPESIFFKEGQFSTETLTTIGEDDYYSTSFRIQFNLSQYNEKLTKTSTNALSQLAVEIKTFRLVV